MKPYRNYSIEEWLTWLEDRSPGRIDLQRENIHLIAERLKLLPLPIPVITVAGTNGKGSTVAALEAIYVSAGYQVGSYTSPHLIQFNERIRLNQQPIDDEVLIKIFNTIEDVRAEVHISYFEMATLAALYYFKQSAVDIVILEVGLGGRLDATNIVDADVAIITTIDFDHQEYLGDTKEAIGYEKAGIFRAGKPAIYADLLPPQSVITHAKALATPLIQCGQDYHIQVMDSDIQITLPVQDGLESVLQLPKPVIHINAAAAAVVATQYLMSIRPVATKDLINAMRTVHVAGRQQVIPGEITTVFDVAHNPQAANLLADFLHHHFSQYRGKIHAVFSGLKDKDLCGLIKPLAAYVDHWYPCILDSKRAARESLLLAAFQAENIAITTCFSNPEAAYTAATQQAKLGDIIVVYGSFVTVAAVMSLHAR